MRIEKHAVFFSFTLFWHLIISTNVFKLDNFIKIVDILGQLIDCGYIIRINWSLEILLSNRIFLCLSEVDRPNYVLPNVLVLLQL